MLLLNPCAVLRWGRGNSPCPKPRPHPQIFWLFIDAKRSVIYGLRNTPECVAGRCSAPDSAGGAHDAPPDPFVGWGGDTSPIPHPTRRLRPLGLRGKYFSRESRLTKAIGYDTICECLTCTQKLAASCQLRTRAHHGDEIPRTCRDVSSYLFTYLPLNYDTPVVK